MIIKHSFCITGCQHFIIFNGFYDFPVHYAVNLVITIMTEWNNSHCKTLERNNYIFLSCFACLIIRLTEFKTALLYQEIKSCLHYYNNDCSLRHSQNFYIWNYTEKQFNVMHLCSFLCKAKFQNIIQSRQITRLERLAHVWNRKLAKCRFPVTHDFFFKFKLSKYQSKCSSAVIRPHQQAERAAS